jgi:hypothetical protein
MSFPFADLRKKLNALLISSAQLEIGGKRHEEISLGEIFGNLDALGYLILLFALLVALVVGFCAAMLLAEILPERSMLYYLGALPGVGAGFLTCYLLFSLRRR